MVAILPQARHGRILTMVIPPASEQSLVPGAVGRRPHFVSPKGFSKMLLSHYLVRILQRLQHMTHTGPLVGLGVEACTGDYSNGPDFSK